MSIQYVIANIEIPIKIENNISEPLPEYMKINITECKELPEKHQIMRCSWTLQTKY